MLSLRRVALRLALAVAIMAVLASTASARGIVQKRQRVLVPPTRMDLEPGDRITLPAYCLNAAQVWPDFISAVVVTEGSKFGDAQVSVVDTGATYPLSQLVGWTHNRPAGAPRIGISSNAGEYMIAVTNESPDAIRVIVPDPGIVLAQERDRDTKDLQELNVHPGALEGPLSATSKGRTYINSTIWLQLCLQTGSPARPDFYPMTHDGVLTVMVADNTKDTSDYQIWQKGRDGQVTMIDSGTSVNEEKRKLFEEYREHRKSINRAKVAVFDKLIEAKVGALSQKGADESIASKAIEFFAERQGNTPGEAHLFAYRIDQDRIGMVALYPNGIWDYKVGPTEREVLTAARVASETGHANDVAERVGAMFLPSSEWKVVQLDGLAVTQEMLGLPISGSMIQ